MKPLIAAIFLCSSLCTQGQAKSGKPANPSTSNPAPKLQASIGGSRGGAVSSEFLTQIVDSPLVVRDQSGISYSVTNFRIFYKFKSTSQDPDTGEKKTVDDMRTETFYNTPRLSDLWSESIKDNIAIGDELIIDNIMVRLKNGKKLLLPSLSFKVAN